jgi:acyl-CoA synthetase (AMP-forming)/AMP-acid ligase II
LRTGDLGVMAGGELAVIGRIKELIILAGRKHHAEDIEATIVAAVGPRRRGVAVAAFAIEIDGSERLAVMVEQRRPSAATGDDQEDLRAAIKGAVARRHDAAVHNIVFVDPGALPRTSSGKVRRHLCRKVYIANHSVAPEAVA